jgi:hypothetical protein
MFAQKLGRRELLMRGAGVAALVVVGATVVPVAAERRCNTQKDGDVMVSRRRSAKGLGGGGSGPCELCHSRATPSLVASSGTGFQCTISSWESPGVLPCARRAFFWTSVG